jgi:hypothetical protein
MFRTTVNNVRDQFIAELNSKSQAIKSSGSPFGHTSGMGTHKFGAQITKRSISTGSSQQIRRQVGYRRVYRVWFATITVTSRSTTTQQFLDLSGDNKSSGQSNTSYRIIIDIRPHPWITLRCALGFIDRHSTGTSFLNCDARLRIYSIIPEKAPIVKACERGDIASAHKLFSLGQASPYDVAVLTRDYYPNGYSAHQTLLDLAINSWQDTVRKISYTHSFGNVSDEIEILKRNFRLFAFLVDCGLDPGEQMSRLPFEASRLRQIACSTLASITSHLADMLPCLVTRSASNPFSFDEKHESNLFLASMEAIPEIAACVMGQESWPLPEPLTEPEYSLYVYNYRRPVILNIGGNAYDLLRDRRAIYTRAELKWRFSSSAGPGDSMSEFCQDILHESQILPTDQSGACNLAIRARLITCLEFGMSPKDASDIWDPDNVSVAEYYRVHGKKHLLESALVLVGWTPDSICIMFEEEASASLVRFLHSFRPVAATSKAGTDLYHQILNPFIPDPSNAAICYLKNRSMALNEGYRKYFPEEEEEEEIQRVVNKYDEYVPVLEPILEHGLPAVNGITQDFWD